MLRHIPRLVLPAVLLLAYPVSAQVPANDPDAIERMRKDIFFLAGPECEGRGVETRGIEKAADYLADAFRQAGLKPAGQGGSYFQPFPMTAFPERTGPSTLAFAGPNGQGFTPTENEDFRPTGYSTGGKLSAALVFVGHGITASNLKYDDYAGLDVKGKWVILIRRTPRPGVERDGRFDTSVPAGEASPYNALRLKLDAAVEHKAAGILLVSDPVTAGDTDPLIAFDTHRYEDMTARLPVLHLTRAAASRLLQGGLGKTLAQLEAEIDKDLQPHSAELAGWTASADVGVTRRELTVKNVVGYLEGSGPLADETVVIGAHYDHLGYGSGPLSRGGQADQGKIHFGADDNASGTTALLELARRFAAMKDRRGRRLVFIAFSGEERGLFGSKFYCEHPLFPLAKTAAMVNLDMVGRLRPGPGDWLGITTRLQLHVYGTGTGDTFDRMVDSTEARYGLKVKKIPAGTGPSDHDSFYRKRVPVLFLFTDYHADYHRPTDTPDRIDLPGMLVVVNLTEDMVLDLSTTIDRPRYAEVAEEPHPRMAPGVRLGVRPDYTYQGGDGMRIEGVTQGGPAEKGGLKDGDVIVDIGGVPVRSVNGYMSALVGKKPGEAIEVTVLRGGKKVMLKVTP
ncbi:MAG TPA: M28 family peptidase [Gemmataceae bacterium]|nr:M28 family peptidase [Gemmataceae bacterium]